MKNRFYLLTAGILFLCNISLANGVGVIDAKIGSYLKLISSSVTVNVENQVAVVTSIQKFKNTTGSNKLIKYAFPMPESGSATELQYKINGQWYATKFTNSKQDTTSSGTGGGTASPSFQSYIGNTPLYFPITDTLKADSMLTVKLTYVQLLPYDFGAVSFEYPNDYHLIQSDQLEQQEFKFVISSQRTISSIDLLSHTAQTSSNTGHSAQLYLNLSNMKADKNYKVNYSLSLTELGLYGISSAFADSTIPDSLGRGFFLFMAEPDPSQSSGIIRKVISIVIDRSGSMSGTKMDQAKSAAKYIVNNLNNGDRFNIIDFDDIITPFKPQHVAYNEASKNEALNYLSNLTARGGTSISGAFETAIPQFPKPTDSTANIIIFLTDGEPTSGNISTDGILGIVNTNTKKVDTTLTIFCFGIGAGVNNQLLSLLATQHNGLCEFLTNDQLEASITRFYTKIKNPVMMLPKITFSPSIAAEVFPNPLPNLYIGQQLLVTGRYSKPQNVNVVLSGQAYGHPVSYTFPLNLTDSSLSKYNFLTKVWAKMKIENLLVKYYNVDPKSSTGQRYKEEIIIYSMLYGVLSPFTSLTGGGVIGTGVELNNEKAENPKTPYDFKLLGNYPNPFNPGTYISFVSSSLVQQVAYIRIYNSIGQLIRELSINVNGSGNYKVYWDGRNESGALVPAGNYIYTISLGNTILAGKMCLLK
ncbi:MAG: VWA domain-containing protein [Bacteroidota bacterium]|nr:VWA domain-containing protein [Bacteroidota bacterium]